MQGVQTPPSRAKRGVLRTLLLIGMGLMIPCYLFTVGNVALSPWPLYERNRLALAILTPLCLALLLLLRRAAETHCSRSVIGVKRSAKAESICAAK